MEDVIYLVMKANPDATMLIKSTIFVGYTEHIRKVTVALMMYEKYLELKCKQAWSSRQEK